MQICEIEAADNAHRQTASAMAQHLQEEIEHSQKVYSKLRYYRRQMIFGKRGQRKLAKIMWILGAKRFHIVLVIDYQMVQINILSQHINLNDF
jgi:hypothetical protein